MRCGCLLNFIPLTLRHDSNIAVTKFPKSVVIKELQRWYITLLVQIAESDRWKHTADFQCLKWSDPSGVARATVKYERRMLEGSIRDRDVDGSTHDTPITAKHTRDTESMFPTERQFQNARLLNTMCQNRDARILVVRVATGQRVTARFGIVCKHMTKYLRGSANMRLRRQSALRGALLRNVINVHPSRNATVSRFRAVACG